MDANEPLKPALGFIFPPVPKWAYEGPEIAEAKTAFFPIEASHEYIRYAEARRAVGLAIPGFFAIIIHADSFDGWECFIDRKQLDTFLAGEIAEWLKIGSTDENFRWQTGISEAEYARLESLIAV